MCQCPAVEQPNQAAVPMTVGQAYVAGDPAPEKK